MLHPSEGRHRNSLDADSPNICARASYQDALRGRLITVGLPPHTSRGHTNMCRVSSHPLKPSIKANPHGSLLATQSRQGRTIYTSRCHDGNQSALVTQPTLPQEAIQLPPKPKEVLARAITLASKRACVILYSAQPLLIPLDHDGYCFTPLGVYPASLTPGAVSVCRGRGVWRSFIGDHSGLPGGANEE